MAAQSNQINTSEEESFCAEIGLQRQTEEFGKCVIKFFGSVPREFLEQNLIIEQPEKVKLPKDRSSSYLSVKTRALVIGNSKYAAIPYLRNPENDAEAIAEKFSSMGISTELILNGSRSDISRALRRFQRTSAEVGILFYAGHGLQVDGHNYMLPVDFDGTSEGDVQLEAIPISSAIEQVPGKTKLVFLDACRDNPFFVASRSRSLSRGLASMEVATGTLIAYATKDGKVALDGEGRHSPFTQALLEHIGNPEDIAVVLRKVRAKVIERTNGQQQPWEYGSLTSGTLILSRLGPKK